MGYHDLSDSGMTAEQRRDEATRILRILGDVVSWDDMTRKEQEFIESIDCTERPVSHKQIFWLRDIKEKYL